MGGPECDPHPELLPSSPRCAVLLLPVGSGSEGCWAGARAPRVLREWVLVGRDATALCSIPTPAPASCSASHTLIAAFFFFFLNFRGSSFCWSECCGDGLGANGVTDRERAQGSSPWGHCSQELGARSVQGWMGSLCQRLRCRSLPGHSPALPRAPRRVLAPWGWVFTALGVVVLF